MEKEILKKGYVTHCLSDDEGQLYFSKEGQSAPKVDSGRNFYWSEVYVEGENVHKMIVFIRKGMALVSETQDRIDKYYKQSIVNIYGDDND